MRNLTGFIVEVRCAHAESVTYNRGREAGVLQTGEILLGYFQQMTFVDSPEFATAHIHEVFEECGETTRFYYGAECEFLMKDITVTIKALPGPASKNRFLPPRYRRYPTWDPAGPATVELRPA